MILTVQPANRAVSFPGPWVSTIVALVVYAAACSNGADGPVGYSAAAGPQHTEQAAASPSESNEPVGRVAGSESRVRFLRTDQALLLHADDAAKAFGWQAKLPRAGKLLTLCRTETSELCVPILLDQVASRTAPDGLYVDGKALAKALGFGIADRAGRLILEPNAAANSDPDVPAYNAAWGEGRGFRIGQRVPDIPLVDLDGREVRFSKFLGRQYIIYCWASW
jgi:hypothetical protein